MLKASKVLVKSVPAGAVEVVFTDEELEKLKLAGRIAAEARALAQSLVKPHVPVLEVCERIEEAIRARGAQPAFPCNVDINEVGAHYTSPPGDSTVIPEGAIVKVDIGVHVEGYISDTAVSVCLSPEHLPLKHATEEALRRTIEAIKPGVKVSALGAVIQASIEKYGLKPIRNLTGHSISRFIVHAGRHIPNISTLNGDRLREGDLFAIEPFATTLYGAGEVSEGEAGNIYRVVKEKPPKNSEARVLFQTLKGQFKTLPFAARWAEKVSGLSRERFRELFGLLLRERVVHAYPVLVEANGAPVGQSEHTVYVTRDGCEVITL